MVWKMPNGVSLISETVKGNLKRLPDMPTKVRKNVAEALRYWVIGDIGEDIAFWVLHKARFWRIVKPLWLQYKEDKKRNVSALVSPNQLRQGLCFLPSEDEWYYRRRMDLTEEHLKLTRRWDFLALKILKEESRFKAYPCLIEVKTQWSETKDSEGYRLFRRRDFSNEKRLGFRVFCLRILLGESWDFEANLEEL